MLGSWLSYVSCIQYRLFDRHRAWSPSLDRGRVPDRGRKSWQQKQNGWDDVIFFGSLNSKASRCPVSKKKMTSPDLSPPPTSSDPDPHDGFSACWWLATLKYESCWGSSSHISMLDHRHKYIHSRNQKLANQDLILVGCCISGKKWINPLTIYLFWVVQVPSSNQTWPLAGPSLQGICVYIMYIYIYVHVDVCVCMHIYLSTSTWSPSPSSTLQLSTPRPHATHVYQAPCPK